MFASAVTMTIETRSAQPPATAADSTDALDEMLLRNFWEFPAIESASFAGDHVINCQLTLRQTPTKRQPKGLKRKFTARLAVEPGENVNVRAQSGLIEIPRPDLIQLESYSPRDRSTLVRLVQRCEIKDGGDKDIKQQSIVEIWCRGETALKSTIDVSELHGKFCTDETFGGGVAWSDDEQLIAYVAERLLNDAESKSSDWRKYDYGLGDWGEKFGDRSTGTVICLIDQSQSSVAKATIIDSNIIGRWPTQVVFGPGGKSLIFRLFEQMNGRQYGPLYCNNRPSGIYEYRIDAGDQPATIANPKRISPAQSESCRSPRVFGNNLFYLVNKLGGPHNSCSQLVKYSFEICKTEILVDRVNEPTDVSEFPGLYLDWLPPNSCRGKMIFLSTQWRSEKRVIQIDTRSGEIAQLFSSQNEHGTRGSFLVADVLNDDTVLLIHSSPAVPASLSLAQRGSKDQFQITPIYLPWQGFPVADLLGKISWTISKLGYDKPIELIRVQQVAKSAASDRNSPRKFLIIPHGGPHSAISLEWNRSMAGFCLMGFNVICVNYVGSIGFGQKYIDQLVGNIGTLDVEQVHLVATTIANKPDDQVFVYGGSHGGFIAGHLATKYPEFYEAFIMRNPVLNVGTNCILSDIPDWSYYETGLDFNYIQPQSPSPQPESYQKMFDMSPTKLIYRLAASGKPCLFLLGRQDRRVPNYEALNWYHYLKSRQCPSRLLIFPDDGHALDSIEAEWFSLQAVLDFIIKYCPPNNH